MSTTDDLISARALLARGWCQGAFAEAADHRSLSAGTAPSAVRWCPIGAIDAAVGSGPGEPGIERSTRSWWGDCLRRDRALDILRRAILRGSIASWADAPWRTHAEILAAMDRAIELSRQPEGDDR